MLNQQLARASAVLAVLDYTQLKSISDEEVREAILAVGQSVPLYESRLKGKLHVISKRYTQRIERHNLNLRQHLARLGRKLLSFSKSVEL
ncbi:IS1 family transposase, partial [Escherichia coli]|uniref:IS1 family transposase n=1 Tax=Escherichia coli TaxID=562 RepID=UPI00208DB34E